jgi:glucosamine--fructose-6-phosphate aminotransferase (isomerizing)
MCGIFGIISKSSIDRDALSRIIKKTENRGRDASGLMYLSERAYRIEKADTTLSKLFQKNSNPIDSNVIFGHSRLTTQGSHDNQPIRRDDSFIIHNGIVINESKIWGDIKSSPALEVDSESILALFLQILHRKKSIDEAAKEVLSVVEGTASCAIIMPKEGKCILLSNNGSLFVGYIGPDLYFSSEEFTLKSVQCQEIRQLVCEYIIIDIPIARTIQINEEKLNTRNNLVPSLLLDKAKEKKLLYPNPR